MAQLNFEQLIPALIEAGYSVEFASNDPTWHADYQAAFVSGNNIRAAFCLYDSEKHRGEKGIPYPNITNRIAADHVNCFDKWSKCPLVMELPVDLDSLLTHLKHLGSDEGYAISNSYAYRENNPYPYEIE